MPHRPLPKKAPSRPVKPPAKAPAYHHGDLRAALIGAAEQLLRERGVDGLTLRACARRAGVSHGAPAHHFGDINGLLDAVGEQAAARLDARMDEFQRRAAPDPMARLIASGLGYIDFAVEQAGLFSLAHRHASADKGRSSPAFARLEAALRGAFPQFATLSREELLPQMLLRWSVVHGFATLVVEGRFDAQLGKLSKRAFAQALGRKVLEQMGPG